jgi:hypothetical protein
MVRSPGGGGSPCNGGSRMLPVDLSILDATLQHSPSLFLVNRADGRQRSVSRWPKLLLGLRRRGWRFQIPG